MNAHPLDNPVWESLRTRHQSLAVSTRSAARYPAEVAPFVAAARADAEASEELCELVDKDESVYLVGVAPPLDRRWVTQHSGSVIQMVCDHAPPPRHGPQFRELTETDRDNMLALTTLVFPGFFRTRTIDMGKYIGIYAAEILAAMAGERMATDAYQEISAVCTHPDFVSRGFAAHLITELCNMALLRNSIPFLHVRPDNARALALYERLGFRRRAELGLWLVQRVDG